MLLVLVGPSVSDPRTGEIIESDIIWYHNHLEQFNEKARTLVL
jgi:hypothetical protein